MEHTATEDIHIVPYIPANTRPHMSHTAVSWPQLLIQCVTDRLLASTSHAIRWLAGCMLRLVIMLHNGQLHQDRLNNWANRLSIAAAALPFHKKWAKQAYHQSWHNGQFGIFVRKERWATSFESAAEREWDMALRHARDIFWDAAPPRHAERAAMPWDCRRRRSITSSIHVIAAALHRHAMRVHTAGIYCVINYYCIVGRHVIWLLSALWIWQLFFRLHKRMVNRAYNIYEKAVGVLVTYIQYIIEIL